MTSSKIRTYDAEFVRAQSADIIDLLVDLGFEMRATIRLLVPEVDVPSISSHDSDDRAVAWEAKEFVTDQLSSADELVVRTTKDGPQYMGDVSYRRGDVWYNLTYSLVESGHAARKSYASQ